MTTRVIKSEMRLAMERAHRMNGRVRAWKGNRLVVMFGDDEAYLYELDGQKYQHVPGRALASVQRHDMSEEAFLAVCHSLVK